MSLRVLIVEDDPAIREVIADALETEGYEVVQAVDGVDGLRLAHEKPPDIILLDLMMPNMDGRTFRANQRQDGKLAHIPVVIVSAVAAGQESGLDAVAYLHKPFDLNDLYRVVARYDGVHP